MNINQSDYDIPPLKIILGLQLIDPLYYTAETQFLTTCNVLSEIHVHYLNLMLNKYYIIFFINDTMSKQIVLQVLLLCNINVDLQDASK